MSVTAYISAVICVYEYAPIHIYIKPTPYSFSPSTEAIPQQNQNQGILLLLLLKNIGNARPGKGDGHPINPSTPASHYQPIEEKKIKGKQFKTKKGESNQANKKALETLPKPVNPTPSNTGSTRSFQRDTERRIKVLPYCEVLQRGDAKVNRFAIKAPRVTRTGTKGTGRAPQSRCFGNLRIYQCTCNHGDFEHCNSIYIGMTTTTTNIPSLTSISN